MPYGFVGAALELRLPEHALDCRRDLTRGDARKPGEHREVLARREVGVERVLLRSEAERPPDLGAAAGILVSNVMLPAVSGSRPQRARISVVLPAPFGPRSA